MASFVPTQGVARAALLAAWVGLLFPGSCHKQQPAVPPQAQAPTVSQPQPAPPPQPAETAPPEAKPAPATPTESATPAPTPAPRPKPQHHPTKKVVPAAPPATASDTSGKTVVPQGGTPASGSQLTPNLTPEEAERMRQATVQLLAATEANLKNLAQSLNSEQQAMVEEIHSYVTQSRTAMTEGDLVRAHNLADKAHQLSTALPKK